MDIDMHGMNGMNGDRLEDILVDAGLVSNDQVQKAKSIQQITGEKMEKIILNEGMDSYKQTLSSLAEKMGVDFVDLENIKVNREAVSKLPADIAKKYFVFPFDIEDNMLFLAMNNPDDIFIIDEIKVFTQTEIKSFLADRRLISKALSYFYKIQADEEPVSERATSTELKETIKESHKEAPIQIPVQTPVQIPIQAPIQSPAKVPEQSEVEGYTEIGREDLKEKNNIPVPQIVNIIQSSIDTSRNDVEDFIRGMVIKAIRVDASDIHVDVYNKKVRVRYRIDSKLTEDNVRTQLTPETVIDRIKVMAGLFTCDRNVPQKGRISYELSKAERIFIDAFTLPTVNGEKLLLKFLINVKVK